MRFIFFRKQKDANHDEGYELCVYNEKPQIQSVEIKLLDDALFTAEV